MSLAMVLVFLIRIISSLTLLKLPVFGAFLVIVIDFFDLNMLEFLGHENPSGYQKMDKLADLFYLSLEVYIVLSWKNSAVRYIALVTFIYRLLGVILFEYTGKSWLLVVFPNIFEYVYLTYMTLNKVLKRDVFVKYVRIAIMFSVITIFKLFHEYVLHIAKPWKNENHVLNKLYPDFIERHIDNFF